MTLHTKYFLILLFVTNVFSDEIFLKNGQNAKTKIIDTIGCEVKILRNGNTVSIKKNLIERIVWNTDTINYVNYICNEKPKKQAVKFEDTPEYKLMVIVDNAPEKNQPVRDGAKIAYMFSPLQGNYNAEEFVGVQSVLLDIIKKKYTLQLMSSSQIYDEIIAEKPVCDYAFIIRKYHVEINNVEHSGLGGITPGEKKKELYTICDIKVYDILRKEIAFHKVEVEKRSVWGERDYSWVGSLTSDKWKEDAVKDQTEQKLDKNAKIIMKKLEKEISKYLGIVE
jgi:hypothetical protein